MQLIRSRRFRLYDYGSAAANHAHYGQEEPPDIAANYHLLQVRSARLSLISNMLVGKCPPNFQQLMQCGGLTARHRPRLA